MSKLPKHQVGLLVDTTGTLNVNEVINNNGFLYIDMPTTYLPHYNYWYRIDLTNTSSAPLSFLLFSNEWKIEYWEFTDDELIYHKKKGVWISKVHDDFYSGQNNETKIRVALRSNETKQIYVKVEGKVWDMPFKVADNFFIQREDVFREVAINDLLAIGIFVGMVIVLLLTNSSLGLIFKEKSNLFYLFFVISLSLYLCGYFKFTWFIAPQFNFDTSILFPVNWMLYALFASNYLDYQSTNTKSWLIAKLFIGYAAFISLGMMILFSFSIELYYHFLPRTNTSIALVSIPFMFTVLLSSQRNKYFVIAGLMFGILGAVLTSLSLHFSFLTESYHYTLVGYGLELGCFQLGLTRKMNQNKKKAVKAIFELREREKEKEHLLAIQELEKEKYESEMQLKNNELYNLSIITASKKEVLDKVYHHMQTLPNPISKELLSEIKSKMRLEEDWKTFKIRFEKTNPKFFKKLLEQTPDLTENELRFAALLVLNLSTDQICQLLHHSKRTVQTSKYRLKKRLQLTSDIDLSRYLHTLNHFID
ncbi:MAG: 7TM diverse intracellular signaling domain-containing protein [Reichenbachiella sp.]|uniref:7TM diverse intracellular signaling domain-containing protein n=1 Tax=Reichenbachiella sp. TaxID=2184521 RepID=UPI00296768BF|nr:7TM diverse intracellular signaling domain-containing protein [Reichenbachiella sp.]MDW3210627.1 7TM diverse intracellular signaling domain-containing protein [Reichenbachiella sp.]